MRIVKAVLTTSVVVLLFGGFLFAVYKDSLNLEYRDVVGVVEDVRVLVEQKETAKGGHPVAGSVVGGLVAGVPGAIVGAAIGDSGYEQKVVSKLLGCTVVVRCDDEPESITLRFSEHRLDTPHAALLRKGDRVYLHITTEKDTGKTTGWVWER